MISQARSPRRARSSNTARSRRPTAVNRLQLSMARCACSAAIALGVGGVVVQVATDGTPAASPAGTSLRNSPKRRKDLNALATDACAPDAHLRYTHVLKVGGGGVRSLMD